MSSARKIALAAAAAGTLLAGSAVLAQEAKKEEPRAQGEKRHAGGEHRGQGMSGMNGMSGMSERCHAGQAKSREHEHQQ
jgi:hypothetical protein